MKNFIRKMKQQKPPHNINCYNNMSVSGERSWSIPTYIICTSYDDNNMKGPRLRVRLCLILSYAHAYSLSADSLSRYRQHALNILISSQT